MVGECFDFGNFMFWIFI